jgi:hypothetical protein
MFLADRRTDVQVHMTEMVPAFRDFTNAPNKRSVEHDNPASYENGSFMTVLVRCTPPPR